MNGVVLIETSRTAPAAAITASLTRRPGYANAPARALYANCSLDRLYALQHLGYTIPPQADAGWIGEAGPGPSYGDPLEGSRRAGFDNDLARRTSTDRGPGRRRARPRRRSRGGQ